MNAIHSLLSGPAAHRFRIMLLLVLIVCTGCGESPTGTDDDWTDVAVVLNSVERSLTVFPLDSPDDAKTIGLGPDGTPVGVAVHRNRALVPMGTYPYAVVVDLLAGEVEKTIALPENSGATGAAFLTGDVALVGNPNRNTVSIVGIDAGQTGDEIDVGGFPQAIMAMDTRVFVLNGELENFSPSGPGTVTMIDGRTFSVMRTIELSGYNPSRAALGFDGRLYVLNAGAFGEGNGSLSALDPQLGDEIAHYEGFGDLPGAIQFGPDEAAYIGAFSYGLAVWDPTAEEFVHSPEEPIEPGGSPVVGALGFDFSGRLFVVQPGDCTNPGTVLRLRDDFTVAETIDVGVCPIDIVFARIVED